MITTAAAIQQACERKNWTIGKLARKTELGREYIEELINGIAKPTLEVVNKIALAISVPTAQLIQNDMKNQKINFTLHLRQSGLEKKAKEKLTVMFERLFTQEEISEMGLEILAMDREVTKVSENGRRTKGAESIISGYLVVRIGKMIDYERFNTCLKNDFVTNILQGEMRDEELNHVLAACGQPVIQIDEPKVPIVENASRKIQKVIRDVQKGIVHISKEVKEKLETTMEQLMEQKRRYAAYLRNLALLNNFRVQKNKKAVFEFPVEIERKARNRLDRLLDDGWDVATVLAIRLAKEATQLHT